MKYILYSITTLKTATAKNITFCLFYFRKKGKGDREIEKKKETAPATVIANKEARAGDGCAGIGRIEDQRRPDNTKSKKERIQRSVIVFRYPFIFTFSLFNGERRKE